MSWSLGPAEFEVMFEEGGGVVSLPPQAARKPLANNTGPATNIPTSLTARSLFRPLSGERAPCNSSGRRRGIHVPTDLDFDRGSDAPYRVNHRDRCAGGRCRRHPRAPHLRGAYVEAPNAFRDHGCLESVRVRARDAGERGQTQVHRSWRRSCPGRVLSRSDLRDASTVQPEGDGERVLHPLDQRQAAYLALSSLAVTPRTVPTRLRSGAGAREHGIALPGVRQSAVRRRLTPVKGSDGCFGPGDEAEFRNLVELPHVSGQLQERE